MLAIWLEVGWRLELKRSRSNQVKQQLTESKQDKCCWMDRSNPHFCGELAYNRASHLKMWSDVHPWHYFKGINIYFIMKPCIKNLILVIYFIVFQLLLIVRSENTARHTLNETKLSCHFKNILLNPESK